MPGYIIHLTEAELIYQALIKRKLLQCLDIDSWKRQFIYGNLLPDAVPKEHKSRSHFWSQKDEGNFIRVPDLSFFLSKYQVSLSNPAICGYYTHLYLDPAFWKRFFPECVKIDGQNAATGL